MIRALREETGPFAEELWATRTALRARWETFQHTGTIGDGVRGEIADSWRRSARAGLSPGLAAAPLDESVLRLHDSGPVRRRFLTVCSELADELADELGDAPATVVACDDFGVVVHRAGGRAALRSADRVNLVPGGVWSETSAGTSGIGLALTLGGPAYVYAAEHYAEALHGFSCAAAVVHHPALREALGALALMTDASISATLARPLIARAALETERRLQSDAVGRERELMEHHLGHGGGATPMISVDRAGHTVIQNARMLQSASGEDVSLLLSLARRALQAGDDVTERLELSRGSATATIRIVRSDEETLGALVSLERARRRPREQALPVALEWSAMVGRSAAMQRLFREAGKIARHRMAVAVHGEPGTGKLMLAEHLHRSGGTDPLTVVHCASEDWERELDAAPRAAGTIVLRRLHALGPAAQLRLCDRLDALAEAESSVWTIALLNSLAPRPGAELLSRVARVSLSVPALRDREHDLELLIESWCDGRGWATGVRPVLRPEALDVLAAQPWPGNIRELNNVLDSAALRGGTVIGVDALVLDGDSPPAVPGPSRSLRELEREAIETALERSGGNVTLAARELGIGRATLHRRLRNYRLLPRSAPD